MASTPPPRFNQTVDWVVLPPQYSSYLSTVSRRTTFFKFHKCLFIAVVNAIVVVVAFYWMAGSDQWLTDWMRLYRLRGGALSILLEVLSRAALLFDHSQLFEKLRRYFYSTYCPATNTLSLYTCLPEVSL